MLYVAFMGLHVAQMTSHADMTSCYDMVPNQNAAIMNVKGCGLPVGKKASLVVLGAGSSIETIRLRPELLLVLAKGR